MSTRILAATAAVALSLFTAPAATESLLPGETRSFPLDQPGLVPAPILMSVASGEFGGACADGNMVLATFAADRSEFGGKIVALTSGIQQAFADRWRRESNAELAPVTLVVAHVFGDPEGFGMFVDVVEFDDNGCAMSRTLLPADTWISLLRNSVGIAV